MDIVFKMLDDGGFVAGDRDSEMTSYAYPSSPHAIVAKKYPKLVAEEMIENERMNYRAIPAVKEYDRKNWLFMANADQQIPPSLPGEEYRICSLCGERHGPHGGVCC